MRQLLEKCKIAPDLYSQALLLVDGGIKIIAGGYNLGAMGVNSAPSVHKDAACAKPSHKLNERIEFAVE